MNKFSHFSVRIKGINDILGVLKENENQIVEIISSEKDLIYIVIKKSALDFRVIKKSVDFEASKIFKQFLVSKILIIVEYLLILYSIAKTIKIEKEFTIGNLSVYVDNFYKKTVVAIYRASSPPIAAQIYDFDDSIEIYIDLQESKSLGKEEMSRILNIVAGKALWKTKPYKL